MCFACINKNKQTNTERPVFTDEINIKFYADDFGLKTVGEDRYEIESNTTFISKIKQEMPISLSQGFVVVNRFVCFNIYCLTFFLYFIHFLL